MLRRFTEYRAAEKTGVQNLIGISRLTVGRNNSGTARNFMSK